MSVCFKITLIITINIKMADARKIVSGAIEGEKESLRSIAHELWSNPELAYKEKAAHKLLTDYLESKGFKVDRGYCDIETAFRARYVCMYYKLLALYF